LFGDITVICVTQHLSNRPTDQPTDIRAPLVKVGSNCTTGKLQLFFSHYLYCGFLLSKDRNNNNAACYGLCMEKRRDYTVTTFMKYSCSSSLPHNIPITIPRLILSVTKRPPFSPANYGVIQVLRTRHIWRCLMLRMLIQTHFSLY
jgi:hypothetical protein